MAGGVSPRRCRAARKAERRGARGEQAKAEDGGQRSEVRSQILEIAKAATAKTWKRDMARIVELVESF